MIRVGVVGRVENTNALTDELVALGADLTLENSAVVLVGVNTIEEARAVLESLPREAAQRAVLVGLYETLNMQFMPQPGTFAALLEEFGVLGAMPVELATTWHDFGFAGRTRMTRAMGVWFGKPCQSPNYSSWAGLAGFGSAGQFLLRLVAVLDEEIRA